MSDVFFSPFHGPFCKNVFFDFSIIGFTLLDPKLWKVNRCQGEMKKKPEQTQKCQKSKEETGFDSRGKKAPSNKNHDTTFFKTEVGKLIFTWRVRASQTSPPKHGWIFKEKVTFWGTLKGQPAPRVSGNCGRQLGKKTSKLLRAVNQ